MEEAEKDKLLEQLLERQLSQLLNIQWVDAPEGATCAKCNATTLKRSIVPFAGPWSGVVRCQQCGYRESVMRHVINNAVTVEPMPEGAEEDAHDCRSVRRVCEESGAGCEAT